MRIIDKIMEHTGKAEEECRDDCPFNYHFRDDGFKVDFTALCFDDGAYCQECLNQEIPEVEK